MAVTLTTDDLQYPDGEMQPVMFPDGDIVTALTAWLAEASGLTTDNDIAKHYIYYRGYTAVANRIASTPSNQSTNQGNHTVAWGDGRVKQFRELAKHHFDEYERLSESANLGQPRVYFNRVQV